MSTSQRGGNASFALGVNVTLNLLLPALILTQAGKVLGLSALPVLLLALALPLGWGVFEFVAHRRYNFYSLVGLTGVVMTGGIGALHLPAQWLAVKEAGVPLVIGLAMAFSSVLRRPFIGSLIESVLDRQRVREAVQARGAYGAYQRLLAAATLAVAASFFLSAALNYVLARALVVSEPGTSAFNAEYGRLTLLSYPIIAGPTLLVLWLTGAVVLWRLKQLSGLPLKRMIRGYE